MVVYPQDVRDFLHNKISDDLLPDVTVQPQIDVAILLVDNAKSDDLSDGDRETIIKVVAGWLCYNAYTTEMETARGSVPDSVASHRSMLERLKNEVLRIAGLATSTGFLGIEGLTGDQKSELNIDRMAGSLPENEEI